MKTPKTLFFELLDKTYEQCPGYDIKIVLGDFNGRLGREDIFGCIIGRYSLHDTTSDNVFRLVDFAAERDVLVACTQFKHLNIHKKHGNLLIN